MDPAHAIRQARLDAGMTQDELAARCGLAQPNLGAYESGRRRPSEEMVVRILAAAKPRPSTILLAHRDQVLALARSSKASNVRVFGSIARGEDTPDSDVDLLVRFDPDASLFDLVELSDELEALLGVHVDVLSEGGLGNGHQEIREQARPL